jgi:cytochrome c5
MSEHPPQPQHAQESHSEEHSSFIRTPKQLIAVVVLAFVVPITIIVILATFASRVTPPAEPTAATEEAVARRIAPVGELAIAQPGDAPGQRSGKQVFAMNCAACHATGALDAPRVGDEARWAPLIKEGLERLTEAAIKGIGKMPPRGGDPTLTDEEIARAIAFMANQAGAKFVEPPIAAGPKVAAPVPGLAPPAPPPAAPAPPSVAAAPAPAAATVPAAESAGDLKVGKTVHDTSCIACHGAGVAGAPRDGDQAAWAPRLKQGMPALYEAALKGKGAMPPRGGNPKLADAEVRAAVDYMVSLVK